MDNTKAAIVIPIDGKDVKLVSDEIIEISNKFSEKLTDDFLKLCLHSNKFPNINIAKVVLQFEKPGSTSFIYDAVETFDI